MRSMIDKMIDAALAVLFVSILLCVLKWGSFIASIIIRKIKPWIYSRKYPINSDTFPIKALKFGDLLEVKGVGTCKYQGKQEGKFYIEALHGKPFDSHSYLYADEDYFIRNCTMLSKGNIVKWQSQTNNSHMNHSDATRK